MPEKYICSSCNQEFNDGELATRECGTDTYTHTIPRPFPPTGCTDKIEKSTLSFVVTTKR